MAITGKFKFFPLVGTLNPYIFNMLHNGITLKYCAKGEGRGKDKSQQFAFRENLGRVNILGFEIDLENLICIWE